TTAVVTLLFESDQPVAFEETEVAPHANLRHFQLFGQSLDAHRAVDFEQINNCASGLFENVFDGGHSHSPMIEGGAGFCQLFGFQTSPKSTGARLAIWRELFTRAASARGSASKQLAPHNPKPSSGVAHQDESSPVKWMAGLRVLHQLESRP